MQIYSVSNYRTNQPEQTSFGNAAKLTLKYALEERGYLIPRRVLQEVKKAIVQGSKKNLLELHKEIYAPLKDCKTLDEARNLFPEFREVLDLTPLLKKGSKNSRQIEETLGINNFSLRYLKSRWAELKTINETAQEMGLKSRSQTKWFSDKARIPELGNNYQVLLKACDPAINEQISQKAARTGYGIISKNSEINEKTWAALPELREKLRLNKGCENFWTEEAKEMWSNARILVYKENYGKK